MYNPLSKKATEFISNEILETIEYAQKQTKYRLLTASSKSKECKGLSHGKQLFF